MNRKIILSADSTCDLNKSLEEKYKVHYYPFHIHLDGKQYRDGVDIFPDDIFRKYYEKGVLPKTAAINVEEYVDYFRQFVERGYNVVHLNLGHALSSAHQNCLLAAKELGNVYPIDSCGLSSGIGILVLEAGEMIEKGENIEAIVSRVKSIIPKIRSSFVLDTLKFLSAGGRCSSILSIGANIFKIKPCIEVSNKDGSMSVGKKYRGDLEKVLNSYVDDTLSDYKNIQDDKIFVIEAGLDKNLYESMCEKVRNLNYFKNIYKSTAGCTISAHCGPNTFGLMYVSK